MKTKNNLKKHRPEIRRDQKAPDQTRPPDQSPELRPGHADQGVKIKIH